MKVKLSDQVAEDLKDAPANVEQAFEKQLRFLANDLRHPSLRAKKYDEDSDRWQARVTKGWRFYFAIEGDTYRIIKLIPHPKK